MTASTRKLTIIVAALALVSGFSKSAQRAHWWPVQLARADLIQLASLLPKIEAIHEDARSLLVKNVELKGKILAGQRAQNESQIASLKEAKLGAGATLAASQQAQTQTQTPAPMQTQTSSNVEQSAAILSMMAKQRQQQQQQQQQQVEPGQQLEASSEIDFGELEEFNKWVEVNLEYAVKNTQATVEALKEEAQQNGGNVEYTEQAVKDGIEGVKYWQSAVIFQDKTLKNETFEHQQLD